jgi:hypothetical protein
MVARRKVGVRDTPTKNTMSIYLLNIPFAILGVSIAVVPLIIGMRHQARTKQEVEVSHADFFSDHHDEEYELAA